MKETTLREIEKYSVIVLVLGSIAIIAATRELKYLVSFAAASAIVTLNFRFLRKIIAGGLSSASAPKKLGLALGLPLKFLVFGGLVAVMIIYGDVDIVYFLIGLSTVFFSVIINEVAHLLCNARRKQHDGA